MRTVAISLVCMAGAVLGWNAAAATHAKARHPVTASELVVEGEMRRPASFLPSKTLVVVPVPAALKEEGRQAREMQRLAVRNRRLEALVRVLRARDMEREP